MDNFYPCLSKVQQYPNDVYKNIYSLIKFCVDLRKKTISLKRPCKIVGKVLRSFYHVLSRFFMGGTLITFQPRLEKVFLLQYIMYVYL
jgi:hypothetical protein